MNKFTILKKGSDIVKIKEFLLVILMLVLLNWFVIFLINSGQCMLPKTTMWATGFVTNACIVIAIYNFIDKRK